ncbi:unnamed protein product [Microthlaspi erraticum]|uniref:Uncharacterized protein n=1 Tax=Microthlaspi erraticum TaxID=1685480 RepID=A0A6D2JL92_9BRAS|nr:unnamed protein product [Microthlaspi erraticum]
MHTGFEQREHKLKAELVTTSHDLSSSRRKQDWKRRTMASQKTGLRQSRSQDTLLPERHRLRQILTASHSSRYANLSKSFRDDLTLQLIILNLKTNELGANCWGRNTPRRAQQLTLQNVTEVRTNQHTVRTTASRAEERSATSCGYDELEGIVHK